MFSAIKKEKNMDWIEVALEEYKTLRAESIEAIKTQQTTLKLGTAMAGAIVISGFNLWDKTLLPDLIFLVFIPILCYIILVIWIGEVSRMMRAGHYLTIVENKISKAYPNERKLLFYENWLRDKAFEFKTPQLKWNYIAVIALFSFISVSSIMVGNFKIYDKIGICLIIVFDLIEILFLIGVLTHIYKISRTFQ